MKGACRALIVTMMATVASAAAEDAVSLFQTKQENYGWTFGDGPEFPGAVGSLKTDDSARHEGRASLALKGDFSKGGGYVQAGQSIRTITDKDVRDLVLWLNDPASERLTFRLIDDSGQVHQFKLAKPKKEGWRKLVFPLAEFFAKRGAGESLPQVKQYEHWAGPNDGKWHGPARSIYLLASKTEATKRTLRLGDVRIIPQPSAARETVRLDEVADGQTKWEFLPGEEFPGATGALAVVEGLPEKGSSGLHLKGDFSKGGAYVGALIDFEHYVESMVFRYRTEDVGLVTLRMADSDGQVFQKRRVKLEADGEWHELEIKPHHVTAEHWGGRNDGTWRGPPRWFSLLIPNYAKANTKRYSLYLADLRAVLEPGKGKTPLPKIEEDDSMPLPVAPLKANPEKLVSRPAYGFDITYRWQAAEPLPANYTVFVHVVDARGETVLQDDHTPPTPTTEWKGLVEYTRTVFLTSWTPRGKVSVPGPAAGEYAVLVGLMDARGRKLLSPESPGKPDDARRYKIADLTLSDDAPLPKPGPKTLDLAGYKLTFSDEFDDLSVSARGPCGPGGTRWMAHTPYGGDFGDARFANPTDDFPFTVEDGILRIEARKTGNRWQAGLLSSADSKGNGFSQKFGYFEMRAKLPEGPGTWPAFWVHSIERMTRAADKSRTIIEIDVVEQYGHWPNKLCTAVHLWNRDGRPSTHSGQKHLVGGMTEGFHTYGVLVTEEFITFYYDGVALRRQPTPEAGKVPLYVMVDLAMGPGWPLDKTPSPQYMYVDYVRVYAKP